MTLYAILLQRDGLPHVVIYIAQDLGESDYEPVLRAARTFAHDDAAVGLLDDARSRHPIQRLVRAGIVVDEYRAVRLEYEESHGLGQKSRQTSGVVNFAASDEEAHGPDRTRRCG